MPLLDRQGPVGLVLLLLTAACASDHAPVPVALRGMEFPLARVDGRPVRGGMAAPVHAGSVEARTDCRNQVADGALTISASGRWFSYRSIVRDCVGRVLLTEINEGTVERRDSVLAFAIPGGNGTLAFRGTWTDSTIEIFDLGGHLEFSRPNAGP